MFISILYMFRAALCSSSGEPIVSLWHLVYVTLYRWPSGMEAWVELHSSLHTRGSPVQSDIYQMSYWYNWLSWWWAHGCLKHVEDWHKHTEKRTVRQVGCLQWLYRDAWTAKPKIHTATVISRHSSTNIWPQGFYDLVLLMMAMNTICNKSEI